MTYLVHYTDLSQPQIVRLDPGHVAAFEEALPQEASAYRVAEQEDLTDLGSTTLVALYNHLDPDHEVKRFATRKDAARRIWATLERVNLPYHEPAAEEKTPAKAPAKGKGKKSPKKAGAKAKATGDEKPVDRSPVRGKRLGIGAFIRERLLAGDEADAILEQVRVLWPMSRATRSDVSWNRNKLNEMKREGKI